MLETEIDNNLENDGNERRQNRAMMNDETDAVHTATITTTAINEPALPLTCNTRHDTINRQQNAGISATTAIMPGNTVAGDMATGITCDLENATEIGDDIGEKDMDSEGLDDEGDDEVDLLQFSSLLPYYLPLIYID